ncbi:M15 family metallopeptidase [Aquabacterium sp. A7-Y]|uniref:M15 family metallopeptidase n=1 Tax=Aquabacterium sp. A7-Y TaxID=1349605 RepID=UPI00223CEE81|nr:M15 family metallopeptidase [Aquabacterium sp. A7-Y]MCW7537698.1 M15 family metallopeptidase [Aquabacterium sp. A7-Y]
MLPALLIYFVLACGLLGLVFLPEPRAWVASRLMSLAGQTREVWSQSARRWQRGCEETTQQAAAATGAGLSWMKQRWPLCAGALALLLLPPAVVYLLRDHHQPGGYADTVDDSATLVAQLLHGEQLVPPPPLPPEVFTTAEVQQALPMIASADRKWAPLDADFRQRLLLVFKIMKEEHGYEMALLEGYRSPERQAMLAALGPHVTQAGAFKSYHQYGLAADCAFYRDGRLVISERDPWAMRGYQLYGEVAARVGLTWGGVWKMRDYGHVELRRAGVKPGKRQ